MSITPTVRVSPIVIRNFSDIDFIKSGRFAIKPEACSAQRQTKKQSNLALLGRFPLACRRKDSVVFTPKRKTTRTVTIRSLSLPEF
mmetsp:Transcript_28763/g.51173  ORF Transcript_28763/g.51173 Transcript_28763/m.51173 type:complete len:86 (-) Transcript_28763:77-334(-)